MPSQISPLTLNGQLKLNTTIAVLLAIFFLFTLCAASCEARHLRVNGKNPSLPSKDVAEVGVENNKESVRTSLMVHAMVVDKVTRVGSKTDRAMGKDVMVNVKMELQAASAGVRNARAGVRVLQQLPRHRDHKGGSSRGSLKKRLFEGTEVRSGTRGRSVVAVESNTEQLGTKAATAYSAETLVVMDYPIARPAPAVHNR